MELTGALVLIKSRFFCVNEYKGEIKEFEDKESGVMDQMENVPAIGTDVEVSVVADPTVEAELSPGPRFVGWRRLYSGISHDTNIFYG